MANRNAPSGFRVAKAAKGGVVRTAQYNIASGLANSLYRGDAVIPVGTNKNIDVATAGVRVIGVFDGCNYVLPNGDTQFRPNWAGGTTVLTGTQAVATVYDDPDVLFEIQASVGLVAADIGALADITAATAGNAGTGNSGQQLDSTTIGSGTVLRIEELVNRVDNAFGTNAKVLVRFALHYLAGGLTAI